MDDLTPHPAAQPVGHGDPAARRRSRRWVPIVAIIVVAIAIGSALYSLNRPTIPDEIEGLILFENLQSEPVDGPIEYETTPPAGGAHSPTTLECGIYRNPVEDEKAVAALATGAVWFAYHPGLSEREIDDLEIFTEGEIDTFMAPYPDLPAPIVLTAWGVQLVPDSPTDTRIASFMRDYKNGDQSPYPDLFCRDGLEVP